MRGWDVKSEVLFSYVNCEARVPKDHPLRPIRRIVDEALGALSPEFEQLYAKFGRPSIPPERLLRALLLQAFYSVRSELQLMEQLDYNLLFRWFVGLSLEYRGMGRDGVHKEPRRLIEGDIAAQFMAAVLNQERVKALLWVEHCPLLFRTDREISPIGDAISGNRQWQRIFAEVPKRIRSPQSCLVFHDPSRRGGFISRDYSPAENRRLRPASECVSISSEPAGVDHHVVIRPEDVFSSCNIERAVSRVRVPRPRFKFPPHRQPIAIAFDDFDCIIGTVVVDDHELPGDIARHLCRRQRIQGPAQGFSAIKGANSHSYEHSYCL